MGHGNMVSSRIQETARLINSDDHTQYGTSDEKHELQESEVPEILGYSWARAKKWSILSVIFLVQCSLNYNASIYNNGVGFLTEKFGITDQTARLGQCVFLICYGLGCELWAPWSEELGRRMTLQTSMTLVNGESGLKTEYSDTRTKHSC